ncbi:Cytokinin riboside 5'-monophosphate phosphoribohydrolase [Melia azedarach]|uniref:Cytokinin riboside 5'-monophosphate phosphoribohydrolase n=1 Tax=Melia azedarach TaxID=155640 RepID=A0ACC1XNM9_MELAZ|nr:Cytokinin riboside 5'-monophosphate phosphoribohydrolase [Melia azedarach]
MLGWYRDPHSHRLVKGNSETFFGEEFVKAADNLGRVLAERKLHLVYGGGSLGLMGCVSTAAHVGGSEVVGIIPKALSTGNITGKTVGGELTVLTMHEQIAKMLDFADAFIALPGGFGTLEEIFQIASWAQLTIHQKPIGLLNINGFFNKLLSFLDHAVEQNFISQTARKLLISASTADELINQLQNFVHEPDPTMAGLEWSIESSKKRKLDLSLRL